MPSRGRDIAISLSTDLTRFDTREGVEGLDDLGDAAVDAGRQLDDLGDAGAGLSRIGDDAHDAAGEVGDSFGEAKDTIKGAANEAAAGFDGSMESVVGSAQGAVAEIGTSMGGLGGIGLLAGAALAGALFSGNQQAAEKFQGLVGQISEGLRGLSVDGQALGGALGDAFDAAAMRDWVDALPEGQFAEMTDDLKKLQSVDPTLTIRDVIAAYNGQADAVDRVTAATNDYQAARREASQGEADWSQRGNEWIKDRIPLLNDLIGEQDALSANTRNLAEANTEATAAEQSRTDALGELSDAQIDLNAAVVDSLGQVADAADDLSGAMEDLPNGILASAQAAADASASMSDTLTDNLGNVDGAFAEIRDRQLADIENTKTYYADLETAYASGGSDLVNWILAQSSPAEAAKLVAMMTPQQRQEIAANYAEAGSLSSQALITAQNAELDKAKGAASDKGKEIGKATADGVAAGYKANAGQLSSAISDSIRRSGAGTWTSSTTKKVP